MRSLLLVVLRRDRRSGWRSALPLCTLLALTFVMPHVARAGFVNTYDCSRFTLINSEFGNGYANCLNGGNVLELTGPHDGSGLGANTDLVLTLLFSGVIQFSYYFATLDPDPGFDAAGYLLNGNYYEFANMPGQTADISLPVRKSDVFGFRVDSVDSIGEPGVLSVSDFTGPESAPEPRSFLLVPAALTLAAFWRRRLRMLAARVRPAVLPVLVVALCACSSLFAQSPATYFGSNATGRLVMTRVVNLSQQSQLMRLSRGMAHPEKLRMPPPRLRPTSSGMRTQQLAPAAPMTTVAMKALAINSSSGAFTLNALSQYEQRLANNANQFTIEPPSPSIAVGNGYILEGVNDAIQVYRTTGAPALPQVLSSNQFFGLAPAIDWFTEINGVYLTDMRVYYDQGIDRWLVIQRSQDNDIYGNPLNQSHLYIGVSRTGDPTGDYNIYIMDTTNIGHPGCPCIADYPQVGSDQYGIHIAYNEFRALSTTFVDASILSLSKSSLASGTATPTAYQFFIAPVTDYEFAIQPALTPPGASNFLANGGVEYFVSTSWTYGTRVALWAMSNTSSLITGNPNPILTRVTIPTIAYVFPDEAKQRPGPRPLGESLTPSGYPVPLSLLDGGDCRVQSLFYASGRLFLSFQTGLSDESGRQVVGGVYMVLSPILRSGVLSGSVLNQGYLMVNGNHLLRPAIGVNALGRGAIAVTLVGPDWYPSAAYIPIENFSTPSTVEVAAPGALPEDGFTGYGDSVVARWGDYNTTVAAKDGVIWMVVQYIGNYPRTDNANWNTVVISKQP